MVRGETYTDINIINEVILNPKAVQVTYRQGNYVVIQKQLKDLDYVILQDEESQENYAVQITCVLSQEETFEFWANDDALVQVRIITSDNISKVFDIKKLKVKECLDCNILPLKEEESHGTIYNQDKTVIPTEEQQDITADSGYTGLGTVTVEAIPSTYVGSAIPRRTAEDITRELEPQSSNYLITSPNGYYENDAVITLTSEGGGTYGVSDTDRTVSGNSFLSSDLVIKGVTTSNILAENIKSGVNIKVGDSENVNAIKNVTGTFTYDADAVASDIVLGKSAYVNGEKIYGELITPFIVKLEFNEDSGLWEPDATLSDIMFAFTSGHNIITYIDDDTLMTQCSGTLNNLGQGNWAFDYAVQNVEGVYPNMTTVLEFYSLTENGVSLVEMHVGNLEEVPLD